MMAPLPLDLSRRGSAAMADDFVLAGRRSITSRVISARFSPCYGSEHDGHLPTGRRAAPRMAAAPAPQPARAGLRGGHLHPASELPRDRARPAQPRDGAA